MKNVFTQAQAAMKHLIKHSTHKHRSGKGVVMEATRQLLNFSLLRTPLRLAAVLCFLLTIGVGEAWGADPTETFSYSTYAGNGTQSSGSSYTMTGTNLSINDTKFYCASSPSYAQSYAGATMTFTPANGVTIKQITITASSSSYNGAQSSGSWSKSAGNTLICNSTQISWTGSQTTAFTLSHTKQLRWTSIVVTYSAPSGYTITYHCNDATSGCPSNASGQSALPNPLPTPSKTGFSFGGWYTNSTLTTSATAGATLSANADLYAKWTCNVTLNRNGATETINDVVYGTALDDIDGTGAQGGCSAWTFAGWSKTQRAAQNNSTAMTLATTVDGAGPYYAVYSHTESGGGETTADMDSFDAISGDVDGDENVSYEASKGDAATTPAVNSSQIRIYQNGGLLTLTAHNDVKLTSITIGSAMGTSVQYAIDGGSYNGTNQSISANGTYTLDDIEADEVVFKCTGTTTSTRLYLNSLSVTYSGGSTTYYSTTATCCTNLGTINGSFS